MRFIHTVWFTFLLTACAGTQSVTERINLAHTLVAPHNFEHRVIYTNTFSLTTFQKITNPTQPIHVYIEGDGFAWVTRYRLSMNPTPKNPVALELALIDDAPNILYIARPCQYTLNDAYCNDSYWSDARFAPEVIDAIDEVIDQTTQNQGIHLVGYSGGGAIATLIAARRENVLSLRTLAGNLDHVAVNNHHNVSQMEGSLNAIEVAAQLADLPQTHFTSTADEVVPPFIAKRFKNRAGDTAKRCIKVQILTTPLHHKGWLKAWENFYMDIPRCT